jgi:hypothetical protein
LQLATLFGFIVAGLGAISTVFILYARIFDEVKQRPLYLVDEACGFADGQAVNHQPLALRTVRKPEPVDELREVRTL